MRRLMPDTLPPLGLYFHVPYCAALCPYCDFAKTANFTADLQRQYLAKLGAHWRRWAQHPAVKDRLQHGLTSVFFGGGTPSLFSREYAPLFSEIQPFLRSDTEVSLEANPDDITAERLAVWRDLGVTRLSIGVQSLQSGGLAVLKRLHDGPQAVAAIQLALKLFPRLNIDLIYGWPGQTLDLWRRDLDAALTLGVQHLSLYNLTYEARTPIGRLEQRGRIQRAEDDYLAELYQLACTVLGEAGFEQDEVSNWSLPGASCKHNWLYWQDHGFIGIGAGAHGYLPDPAGPGVRYAYGRNDRAFIQFDAGYSAADDLALAFGVVCEPDRTVDHWLTEVVGSGLRTRRGIPLRQILARLGWAFTPTAVLHQGLERGLVRLTDDGHLQLAAAEWFREAAWGVEVLRSCAAPDR